ncbi:hypothetical protein ES703_16677 [subsurface metagenome]
MQEQVTSPFAKLLGVGAGVIIGSRGLVHIWGRNDMTTRQQLGIRWEVRDPDGVVVEDFDDWEWGYTGPGDEQDFVGNGFDLNKPGPWTIKVELIMNPPAVVIVDRYDGVLCEVTEEFSGTITRKELKYDSVVGNIPVT